MKTAAQVQEIIEQVRKSQLPASEAAWKVAMACVGWAYVYGAYGEYCDPSNRRRRYRDDHETIKTKCKNFNGRDDKPSGCVGCKWFLGTADSDPVTHEGRTRFFDCRGFVWWVLNRVLDFWPKGCPAGATTMWNTESNWKAKGMVKDGVPRDTLVCLFYPSSDNPNKMAHVGFGFNNETVECSSGVEHHTSYNKKWTHWGVPTCIDGVIPPPEPGTKPTLRKGDRGEWVTLAQTELLRHGYSVGDSGADGVFGTQTEKAVKRFQQDNVDPADGKALKVDGIIGKSTWAALDSTEIPLYTVTIPHLPKYHADALVANYSGAYMTEEEGR